MVGGTEAPTGDDTVRSAEGTRPREGGDRPTTPAEVAREPVDGTDATAAPGPAAVRPDEEPFSSEEPVPSPEETSAAPRPAAGPAGAARVEGGTMDAVVAGLGDGKPVVPGTPSAEAARPDRLIL